MGNRNSRRLRSLRIQLERPVKISGCELSMNIRDERWDVVSELLNCPSLRGSNLTIGTNVPIRLIEKMIAAGITVEVLGSVDGVEIDFVERLTSMRIAVQLGLDDINLSVDHIRSLIEAGARVISAPIRLDVPSAKIRQLLSIGVKARIEDLSRSSKYDTIEQVIRVVDNLEGQHIDIGRIPNLLIVEYMKFVRMPIEIHDIGDYIFSSYQVLVDEYDNLDGQQKMELFNQSIGRGYCHYIRYMFQNGFEPRLSKLRIRTASVRLGAGINKLSKLTLFRCLDNIGDDKYSAYKMATKNDRRPIMFLSPWVRPYWDRLKSDPEIDNYVSRSLVDALIRAESGPEIDLQEAARSYNIEGTRRLVRAGYQLSSTDLDLNYYLLLMAGDLLSDERRRYHFSILSQCNHHEPVGYVLDPEFEDLWSEIPTDNEELLWILYHRRLPLPPHKNKPYIMPRLLLMDPVEAVKNIVNDSLLLLRFINCSGFNIRSMLGYHPKLDLLIEHQPILNMKSAN